MERPRRKETSKNYSYKRRKQGLADPLLPKGDLGLKSTVSTDCFRSLGFNPQTEVQGSPWK